MPRGRKKVVDETAESGRGSEGGAGETDVITLVTDVDEAQGQKKRGQSAEGTAFRRFERQGGNREAAKFALKLSNMDARARDSVMVNIERYLPIILRARAGGGSVTEADMAAAAAATATPADIAHRQGFLAGRDGVERGLNPHTEDVDLSSRWDEGWEQGEAERQAGIVAYRTAVGERFTVVPTETGMACRDLEFGTDLGIGSDDEATDWAFAMNTREGLEGQRFTKDGSVQEFARMLGQDGPESSKDDDDDVADAASEDDEPPAPWDAPLPEPEAVAAE